MKRNITTNIIYNVVLLVTFTIMIASCLKKQENIYSTLNICSTKAVHASDIMLVDNAIPLKTGNSAFQAGLVDLYKAGDKFIAHDNNRVIYIFDCQGHQLSSSEHVIGHGHGEYDNMLTYSYNMHNNTIEVITPQKMKIFDLDFNFIEERNIPSKIPSSDGNGCMFSEIYDLDSNIHALLPSSTSQNKNSIIFYDSSNEKILKTIDYNQDIVGMINMQAHSFTDVGDSIVFYPPGISKYIYSIKRDLTLSRTLSIIGLDYDYDNTDNERQYSEYALNSKDIMPLRLLYVNGNICFLAKEGNSINDLSYLISTENGSMNKFMIRDGENKSFPITTCTDGSSIYGLCDEEDLHGYYASVGLNFPDSLNSYQNVILQYKLK